MGGPLLERDSIVRCLNPFPVGFQSDGKTIAWSYKKCDKQYAQFALPCGKCIECRLEYARQWAIRCVHEAKMHELNAFITLTYNDENLTPRLNYKDFQDFAKRLRETVHRNTKKGEPEYEKARISYFVTGEYGEKTKRPHWHAIIFNWCPADLTNPRSNSRGDVSYRSATLDRLWGKGHCEIGTVTFESAGYVARYAAKKLVHGADNEHDFQPISKKSSRRAIGVSWLEKYYKDAFNHGEIVLQSSSQTIKCGIPRYYEKWLKKHKPEEWLCYIERVKAKRMAEMEARANKEKEEQKAEVDRVLDQGLPFPIDRPTVKKLIIEDKFKRLQENLKGEMK